MKTTLPKTAETKVQLVVRQMKSTLIDKVYKTIYLKGSAPGEMYRTVNIHRPKEIERYRGQSTTPSNLIKILGQRPMN